MKTSLKNSFILSALIFLSVATTNQATAQLFSTLYDFTVTPIDMYTGHINGGEPKDGLLLIGDTFYGTTTVGGAYDSGTIFTIKTNGTGFTNIYNFSAVNNNVGSTNADGATPSDNLLRSGNVLYGTTAGGGLYGSGTLFKINLDGSGFSNIYNFSTTIAPPGGSIIELYTNSDGASPFGGLIISGNTLYGTTIYGGSGANGTIFSINTDGTGFTNLHSFSSNSVNGFGPGQGTNYDGGYPLAALVLAGSVLYGATSDSGSAGFGTIYKINPDGTGFTTIYNFTNGADGCSPLEQMTVCGNTLYGTAAGVGGVGLGAIFKIDTAGSNFTVLHTFTTNDVLAYPYSSLTLSGNILYGCCNAGPITLASNTASPGGVFSIKTDGTDYQTLCTLSPSIGYAVSNANGSFPYSKLVLANSALYGTTYYGGAFGVGTIFKLDLRPSFFDGEIASSNGVYYLPFSSTNFFGFYNYNFFPYIYHYDLGFEYFLDANDGHSGAYFFDFGTGHFWYSNPADFPFLYDFSLNSWLYYFPDPNQPGRYTSNFRYFYNFNTGQIITQ